MLQIGVLLIISGMHNKSSAIELRHINEGEFRNCSPYKVFFFATDFMDLLESYVMY